MKPNEYILSECGIVVPIRVLGALTVLRPGRDVPVVFLIDEQHRNDTCTTQNINNAFELIQKAQVNLIGVESHRGGREWDDYDGKYRDTYDIGENLVPVNSYPQFADCMRLFSAKVLGVECLGMLDQEHCELAVDDVWRGRSPKDHPLNQQRSEHFVRTLLELRSRHGLKGNLVLNAGGDHNSHIEGWIGDGSIETKACQKAAYVRLRAPAYRE